MPPAPYDLTGQVAIVTGGGGGLGRAIALAFADAGADVVIADIVPERCEEVAARVRDCGRQALPVAMDAADTTLMRDMVARAERHFGRIDILVNNAGGVSKRGFLEQSERSWRKHIDLNLVSMLTATQATVPVMIKGGRGGNIINITSIEASRAAPGFSVYAACKAGMNNFTRTLALELASENIRVNAIAPDYTVTPGTRGNATGPVDEAKWFKPSDAQIEFTRRRIPLGAAGDAEDIGKAALFLASQMSNYVTGIVLPVDGGTFASSGWIRDDNDAWTLTGQIP